MFNFKKDKTRKTKEEARKELSLIMQIEFIEKVMADTESFEMAIFIRKSTDYKEKTGLKFSPEFNLKLLKIILEEKENQLKGN